MKQYMVYSSLQSTITKISSFAYRLIPVLAITALLFVSSCETPEKVLKSNDIEYKKAKAIQWYNKKEYFKCIPVFEELIGLMKGRQSVEDLYYMYCMANYKQGDYMISAYHFKNFYDQYNSNEKAEECLFMYAKSYQQLSPKPELDQTYTYKALDAYQFFLNMYPQSNFVYESNVNIGVLRKKLEKKAFNTAELYYRTNNYRAAATCYENLLRDFPDIDEAEKISYLIVKSNYKYADNSIPQKKAERYNHVIEAVKDFKYKYPESKNIADAAKSEAQSHYYAVRGAFEWAEAAPLEERENAFNLAFAEAKKQAPFISAENQKNYIAQRIEKGHFLIIKGNYQLSEYRKESQKLSALQKTVKTYYNFVDLFPKSHYLKEAEKIFNNTNDQIKKLKGNG